MIECNKLTGHILEYFEVRGSRFSPEAKMLIGRAILYLEKNKDSVNGLSHSLNLLEYLRKVENSEIKVFSGINCEAIVLAIFWHDIWKSGIKVWGVASIVGLLFEGPLSAAMFSKEARQVGLRVGLMRITSQIIANHSVINFGHRTVESRIFHDIDLFDEKDSKRTELKASLYSKHFVIRLLQGIYNLMPRRYYFGYIKNLGEER